MIFDLAKGEPEKMEWIGENMTYHEAQEINCFRVYDNKAEEDQTEYLKKKHGR